MTSLRYAVRAALAGSGETEQNIGLKHIVINGKGEQIYPEFGEQSG